MNVMLPEAELVLAPAIGPFLPLAGGKVSSAVELLGGVGFAAIQLDVTLPGIRPRELSQRARRDLKALFVRRDQRIAGLDLFVPRKHYQESQRVDRAMAATLAAIELAADLGRLPLSLALPVAQMDADLRATLVEAADRHDVILAVHAEDQIEAALSWAEEVDLPVLGLAIDPAAVLIGLGDPGKLVHRIGRQLRIGRLSDATATGAEGISRCPVGQGELDVMAYRLALHLAGRRSEMVVLDVRALADVMSAVVAAQSIWDAAASISS